MRIKLCAIGNLNLHKVLINRYYLILLGILFRICHQLERTILLKTFWRDTRKKMFCIAGLCRLFFDVVGRQNVEKSTFCLIGDIP